jgi:CubicO group peptidase (beta-lactamase class C family)
MLGHASSTTIAASPKSPSMLYNFRHAAFLSSLVILGASSFQATGAPNELAYGKLSGYPAGPAMHHDYGASLRVGGFSGKRLEKIGGVKTTVRSAEKIQIIPRELRSEWPIEFDPNELLKNNPIMSLTLIKNGAIVYEKFQYDTGSSSTFNSESMAKTLTALVIGVLLDEGKIKSLSDRLDSYVPEFKDGWFGSNTIRDLLQMQCGLSGASAGATGGFYANIKYGPTAAAGPNARNLYEYMQTLPMTSQPGTAWAYDPVCSDALSMVITKVTGQLLATVFEEKIWKNIGSEHNAYWAKATNTEITSGANQFWAKSGDWAKIALLLVNRGEFKGVQIVPQAYVDSLISDYVRRPNTRFGAYGYQTWKQTNEPGASAAGFLGQKIWFDPESKSAMIVFAVDENEKDSQPFWRWFRTQNFSQQSK